MSTFDNPRGLTEEVRGETVELSPLAKKLSDELVEARSRGENLEPRKFGPISVSIQAGRGLYCKPRTDRATAYTEVELGFPNEVPPDYILQYAEEPDSPTETVYGYVPIELVARWMRETVDWNSQAVIEQMTGSEGEQEPSAVDEDPSERNLSPEEIRERLLDPNFLPRRDEITTAFRGNRDAWFNHCFDKGNPVFEFLNEEHVTALAGYFADRAKSRTADNPLVILEVGAGNGRLSHMLRGKLEAMVPDKVKIVATDSGDWGLKSDFQVEQLGHQEAMEKYQPEVVVFSWMPYQEDISKDFRSNESVQEYVLIGETDWGCCGDEWETWGLAWSRDDEGEGDDTPLHKKDGFERVNLDDISDLQSCRTDSPGEYHHSSTVSFRRKA